VRLKAEVWRREAQIAVMRSEIDEQNSFTLAAKEIALGLLARYS